MNILNQNKLTKVFNRGIARTLTHLDFLSFENQEIYRSMVWELKDEILRHRIPNNDDITHLFKSCIYKVLEFFDYLPIAEKAKIKKGLWLLKDDVFIALGFNNG